MTISKLRKSVKSTAKTAAKTAPKTAAKKPAKKPAKAADPKADVRKLAVTPTELALCLGLAVANITTLSQTGTLRRGSGGRFPLVESVSAYCRAVRERKNGGSKSDLELEHIALKNEKLKEQLRSWRMQRDREVAMGILEAQRNVLQKLRDECKLVPALVEAIDQYLAEIDRVDVEQISYTIEGEAEDDDE